MAQAHIDEVRALHNQICVVGDTDLVRVIGIHMDAMDLYYRVRPIGTHAKPSSDRLWTMVGWCVSLRDMPRHDRMSDVFALNGCPPTETFSITADTRAQFGDMAGDDGLAQYDGHVAPLLIANGVEPDMGEGDPAADARAAFARRHPEHAAAVEGLVWMGRPEGMDRFRHPECGDGFRFDRDTGRFRGDLDEDESDDVAAVMARLASIVTSVADPGQGAHGRLADVLAEATRSPTRRVSIFIGGTQGGSWETMLGGHVAPDGALRIGIGLDIGLDGAVVGDPGTRLVWKSGHAMPDGERTERFRLGESPLVLTWSNTKRRRP